MKIHKNDTIKILVGKDKNKTGKVLKVFPTRPGGYPNQILVEGINLRKKHRRPRRSGEKGQIIEMPAPISISNIKLICPKCGKATKVGYKVVGKKKYRICKKCKQEV